MKKARRLYAIILVLTLMFTGCSNAASKPDESSAGSDTPVSESTTPDDGAGAEDGDAISVADIKDEYEYDDSKDVMPLYNVSETEVFEFKFAFNAHDENIGLYDYVSVHTDADCEEESSIYYNASLEVEDGVTTLMVAPMRPVLGNDSQDQDYAYERIDSWGNAPIYYLAIHYDMEADSAQKLDTPIVIPFTVKHEVAAPTVRGVVSIDGRFSLEWDAVDGAERYIVYNLVTDTTQTGVDNHAVEGAKIGYNCGRNTSMEDQLYLHATGETTECFFDGFSGPESHSLAETVGITGKPRNSGQNYSVHGEYFVTAVVNGKESGLSNPVSTAELALPYRVLDEDAIQGTYPTPADFPSEVRVLNIDGSITVRKVNYERVHVEYYELSWDEYDYVIDGTYLYGSVKFEEDEGEPVLSGAASVGAGLAIPKDAICKVPKTDVDTIIPVDKSRNYDGDPLVSAQAKNTREHIENGDQKTVENLPKGVYINAETAEEEWLALNLVQANQDISVEGFPSLQNPYTLSDIFYKVYYQNPYILGITSFYYDYNEMVFHVEYTYDRDTIRAKQTEIAAKAAQVVEKTVTANMSDAKKVEVLYDYLANHAVYDWEALEDAENNGFKKDADSPYEDSFNTYGILVKEVGVCMSYAYVFRLLCDMSGVDCIVATGYLNGNLPHAWNMVCLDGNWYEIDCTNNEVNTGIPYYLYLADTDLARESGFTKDEMFAIDEDVRLYNGSDSSLEYYYQSGLCPSDMEEYKQLILDNVTKDTGVFIVRWQKELDKNAFGRAVVLAYNELGLEDQINSLRYSATGGFIIIINDKVYRP